MEKVGAKDQWALRNPPEALVYDGMIWVSWGNHLTFRKQGKEGQYEEGEICSIHGNVQDISEIKS